MNLKKLYIKGLRNLKNARIEPGYSINIITGENASGKSSLLEAIHLLGRGVSFRTTKTIEIINQLSSKAIVTGDIHDNKGHTVRLGIEIKKGGQRIKISGKEVNSRLNLINCFPLQIVSPGSHILIEGPPKNRRQFIDWGVFHMEQSFQKDWQYFNRALAQRNALLKTKNTTDIVIWDMELDKYGTMVSENRNKFLSMIVPKCFEIVKIFLGINKFEINYHPGWDCKEQLVDNLYKDRMKDLSVGYTHSGPHRADVEFIIDGHRAKGFISRGQKKLLVLALHLAQIRLIQEKTGNFGCFLVDDFCAELDKKHLQILMEFLVNLKIQCFLTATSKNSFEHCYHLNSSMFHVEHDSIKLI